MSLTDSLISYWTLDEASGTRVDSVVASANDLTDNNTVTQAGGLIATAGQFTAANSESLTHTDNASLSTGDIDFTIACWVFLTTKSAQMAIVAKRTSTSVREYQLDYFSSTDRFRFLIFNSSGSAVGTVVANALGAVSTATWYFIVAWHDSVANTVNIQINDGTADSAAETGVPSDTAAIFNIGADQLPQSIPFNGRIDEVGFWKRTLTTGEKTTLYNGGSGLTYPFTGSSGIIQHRGMAGGMRDLVGGMRG